MDIRTLIESGGELVGSLTPSLIGSAVAQVWKPALPFRERFVQWVVGSTVSFYATQAVMAVTGCSAFVAQSVAFGIALIAFDATPRVIRAVTDIIAARAAKIADRYIPGKD